MQFEPKIVRGNVIMEKNDFFASARLYTVDKQPKKGNILLLN